MPHMTTYHLTVPFYFNRIAGWHSLDELSNISEKRRVALREPHFQCISSSASGHDTCHGPWTGDNRYGNIVSTLLHHFYTDMETLFLRCCSTCGFVFGKSVLNIIRPHCRDLPPSTHVEQKPRNPRREVQSFRNGAADQVRDHRG